MEHVSVDLIDDLWRKIFGIFDSRHRAEFLTVCKRWKSVLDSPLSWIELDVKLLPTQIPSFSAFVSARCSLAAKVHVELLTSSNWRTVFESLFTLQHLRFLKLTVGELSNDPQPFNKTPNWSNLIYLNITSSTGLFHATILQQIIAGAPNLEELYLHRLKDLPKKERYATLFQPLQKLKYLSLPKNLSQSTYVQKSLFESTDDPFGAPVEKKSLVHDIVDQLPNLCTLITPAKVRDLFGDLEATAPVCEQRGKTSIISSSLLMSRDLAVVKQIGPLLKKSNYALYFFPDNGHTNKYDVELLHYLFLELKLDVNCTTSPSDPFVVDLIVPNKPPAFSCPLGAVLADVDEVKKMLDFGADPNMAHPNLSPFSSLQVTKNSCLLLLERGANPLKDVNGKAALTYLFSNEKLGDEDIAEIVRAALSRGIDPNQAVQPRSTYPDRLDDLASETLLDLAAQHNYRKTFDMLLAQGARWTESSVYHLLTWGYDRWTQVVESEDFDVSKMTLSALLMALRLGYYNPVLKYIKNWPRDLNKHGYTLLHYLVARQLRKHLLSLFEDGASTTLERLINEAKLDVNCKSANGETPLWLACAHQAYNLLDAVTISTLINSGARVNEPDVNGWTPLHSALFLRNYITAKYLLNQGANINAQDKRGVTPLMAFVLGLRLDDLTCQDMWTYLLDQYPDLTLTDKPMSRSILHYLAVRSSDILLDLVLSQRHPGLDVNCRDAHGFTPLHYAALSYSEVTMTRLIAHGADVNAVTNTLKLTPFAVLMAVACPGSPYHRYLSSYCTLHQTQVAVKSVKFDGSDLLRICMPNRTMITNTKEVIEIKGYWEYFPFPTDLALQDQFGNTCLHEIARHPALLGAKYMLLPRGIDELWSVPNKFGMTPVHVFTKYTFRHPMYLLKDATADLLTLIKRHRSRLVFGLTHRDVFGQTATDYLLSYEHFHQPLPSAVKEALYQIEGIKFSSPITTTASSAIHTTIDNNAIDKTMLKRIIESDPDALNQKINGKTPLILLTEKWLTKSVSIQVHDFLSALEIFDTLVALKADMNAQDDLGNTALHHACYFFHLGGWDQPHLHTAHVFSLILFKLLEGGARVDVRNNDGQTATDIVPNLLQLDRSLAGLVNMGPVPLPVRIDDEPRKVPTRPIDIFM